MVVTLQSERLTQNGPSPRAPLRHQPDDEQLFAR